MRRLRAFFLRFAGLFNKQARDHEFADEMRSHLQLHIEDNLRTGMSAAEARRKAILKLGGIEQTKESYRDRRGLPWLETLLQDVRYAARMLRKSPGFASVAVLTLALGIGANAAIFSVVYSSLLKALPFKDADRLVVIEKRNPPRGWVRNPISAAEFLAWRNQTPVLEDMAAFTEASCVLTGGGGAEEDPCEVVLSSLFPLLGAEPLRGRGFSPDEDKPGGAKVAILSYGLWQRRFGGEEGVIGRAIHVNGASYTVVGVMPADFSHLYASPYSSLPQLWLSGISLAPTLTWNDYFAIGRLKPDATLRRAETEMDLVSLHIGQTYPELRGWRAQIMSLRSLVSGDTRSILLVLMGAVTFVLLIACCNVANLLLARGAGRAGEFAVRKALGAGQWRLIRQLLTENLLISLGGGALGLLFAFWGNKGLLALAPPSLVRSTPGLAVAAVDVRVLAFTFACALATTLFFGLAPALQSTRSRDSEALKDAGRNSLQSSQSGRFRGVLVIAEIAFAMVLLTGAGLMIRTLAGLSRVNLGFNPANVLTLRVPLSGARYTQPQARAEFWRQAVASVEALPGVESASVARGLPMEGWAGQFFTIAEQPNPQAGQVPDANYVVVGPGYFRTLEILLRKGRYFDEHDTQSADRVVIVNEELARRYWPGQDPLGKRLRTGAPTSKEPWLTVIGVVGNVLTRGPDAGLLPELYIPYQQYPWLLAPEHLVVRAAAAVNPASLAQAVVQKIQVLDKDQPATDVRTMEQIARETTGQERMVMSLLGAFAALALVLSALGLYSVLSYAVAQRTREIGVRVALGAQRHEVLQLVVGGGARLAILGIAVGITGSLALTQLMTDLLFGVRATDPPTFVGAAILLAAVSITACYIPARRAMRVDPMVALRYE
jgi:predicted permease